MKFQYYITDLNEGEIVGTDSYEIAYHFSLCDNYFVLDSHTGEWMLPSGESVQVGKV